MNGRAGDLVAHLLREGWPEVEGEAAERGGLPRWVREEVRRYLECGVLRHGFSLVKCERCKESVLVGFSCKGRGWCPSCGARRSEETALRREEILPRVKRWFRRGAAEAPAK